MSQLSDMRDEGAAYPEAPAQITQQSTPDPQTETREIGTPTAAITHPARGVMFHPGVGWQQSRLHWPSSPEEQERMYAESIGYYRRFDMRMEERAKLEERRRKEEERRRKEEQAKAAKQQKKNEKLLKKIEKENEKLLSLQKKLRGEEEDDEGEDDDHYMHKRRSRRWRREDDDEDEEEGGRSNARTFKNVMNVVSKIAEAVAK